MAPIGPKFSYFFSFVFFCFFFSVMKMCATTMIGCGGRAQHHGQWLWTIRDSFMAQCSAVLCVFLTCISYVFTALSSGKQKRIEYTLGYGTTVNKNRFLCCQWDGWGWMDGYNNILCIINIVFFSVSLMCMWIGHGSDRDRVANFICIYWLVVDHFWDHFGILRPFKQEYWRDSLAAFNCIDW